METVVVWAVLDALHNSSRHVGRGPRVDEGTRVTDRTDGRVRVGPLIRPYLVATQLAFQILIYSVAHGLRLYIARRGNSSSALKGGGSPDEKETTEAGQKSQLSDGAPNSEILTSRRKCEALSPRWPTDRVG